MLTLVSTFLVDIDFFTIFRTDDVARVRLLLDREWCKWSFVGGLDDVIIIAGGSGSSSLGGCCDPSSESSFVGGLVSFSSSSEEGGLMSSSDGDGVGFDCFRRMHSAIIMLIVAAIVVISIVNVSTGWF